MGEKEKEVISMTNMTFISEAEVIMRAINNATKNITITDNEVKATEKYQQETAKVAKNNAIWKTQLAAIKAANAGIEDAVAIEVCKQMTNLPGEETDADIVKRLKNEMLEEKTNEASAKAIEKVQESAYVAKALYDSMFPAQQTQVVSAPAPAPSAPAESRMTMAERKTIIRDMVGSGSGTSQFRRHCSTTAQANEARALIERWRSLGYITGGQKAELRAEVNAAAWLGHCGVTATR